jgi:hypothetical protein
MEIHKLRRLKPENKVYPHQKEPFSSKTVPLHPATAAPVKNHLVSIETIEPLLLRSSYYPFQGG